MTKQLVAREFRGTRRLCGETVKLARLPYATRQRLLSRRSVALGLLSSFFSGMALAAASTISNLPAASAPGTADQFIVAHGGASKKATGAQVQALAGGGSASNPLDFDTVAAVQAATIAGTVNHIRTAGYTTVGDGGGSDYIRKAAQPGHALWIRSVDGAYWEWNGKILTPECGGAIGDAQFSEGTASSWRGTDNTVALQNVIDAHIYFNLSDRVSFRRAGAVYRTTKSLQMGYANTFVTGRLEGPGRAIGAGYSPIILCDFNNSPGLCVNGGRDTLIQGITFWGRIWDWHNQNNMGAVGGALNGVDDSVAANWVGAATGGPALSTTTDTQYTQYAAISIDPYSGPQPKPAYPIVAAPRYAGGATNIYGNSAPSSNTLTRNCGFHGFVVGIACQTSNWDSNGDFTRQDNCVFENNKIAIAVGNTQSREVSAQGTSFANAWAIWDTNSYGHQQGKIGGTQLGCDGSQCMNVFNIGSTSIAGPFNFQGFYIEAGFRLGTILANAASETSVGFYDCQFDFSGQVPASTRGIPATMLDGANQYITLRFSGGVFTNYYSIVGLSFNDPDITFDGTLFQAQVVRAGTGGGAAYKALASNATGQGLVMPRWNNLCVRGGKTRIRFVQCNVDTNAVGANGWVGPRQQVSNRPYCACYHAEKLVSSGQQDDDGVVNPQRKNVNAIDKTQITTPTLTNSGGKLVLVFTMPAGWTTFNQAFYGPGNGDVLYDDSTGSVFFVRSVAAGPPATITAVLQNNYKVVAGVAQPIVAITFTGGYFWTLVSRYYTPTQFTVGTFSTSAATITGVGAPQGGNSWVTTDIKVNDIIYNDDTRSNLFGSQNGTLTAVAAATLTMSAKSYSNATQQRLALFIRVPPANSTVN